MTEAAPQDDALRRGWCQRTRYIGATLALELVLGGFLTLISVAGLFFAPMEIAATTHYRVAGGDAAAAATLERARANWSGPGTTTMRVVPLVAPGAGNSCGSQTLEVETVVRGGGRQARDLLAGVERAAAAVDLGAPCDGARVRFHSLLDWQSAMGMGRNLLAPLLLFLVWRSRRGRPWLIDWADWTPRVDLRAALRRGAGVGGLSAAIAFGLAGLGQLAGLESGAEATFATGMMRASLPWLAPLFVVCAPLVEEYLFRAWMLERFRRVMPAWLALVLSTLAFVALHVPNGVLQALAIASAGLLFGLTWLRTRSWLACTLAHGVHNGALWIVLWAALPA